MNDMVTILAAAKRKWEAADLVDAERLWRLVLAKDPAHPQAARLLSEALLDVHRRQDAFEVAAAAARRRPFDVDLRLLMGRCMHTLGNIPAAWNVFQSVLRSNPASVPARIGLAEGATASRRAAEAVAMLQPLLASNPNDAALHAALAHAYFGIAKPDVAKTHFLAAVRLRPAAVWRAELALTLHETNRLPEAIAEFDKALATAPSLEMAIAGKAQALIDLRQEEEARRIVTEALNRGACSPPMLIVEARLARTPEQRAVARELLERHLTVPQPASSRISMLFSLGTLKEADGEHDAAFECFRNANEQGGPGAPARAAADAIDSVVRVFSRQNMERLPRRPQANSLPVFIVGMPRSGTSLVEQIIASHPSAYGAGELPDIDRIASDMPKVMQPASAEPFPMCVHSLLQSDIQHMSDGYLARLRDLGGDAQVVTDKMPSNYIYCGLIELLFPGARIVHCRRSPLDTCLSIYTTPLSEVHSYRNQLGNLAATYREYSRMMAHWRDVLRIPMTEVVYEDVVADPERHARRIIEFVGLPWDDRCLKFYENRRAAGTASTDQVRRPVYHTSIARWKKYERHLGELIEGLRGVD